jgi:anaerobic ribonucleoside-triphosphate reductase activating protein
MFIQYVETRSNLFFMITIPSGYVNVAAVIPSTHALGPGERAVVWVQGCPFHCDGCIAPEWLPIVQAHLIPIEDLVNQLLSSPSVTGLTFSGGEPMLQARSLAQVARLARQRKDVNIITFSGFHYEDLQKKSIASGIPELLSQIDVLVDGPYIKTLNNGIGLRGSSNQHIIYLTSRLQHYDLENWQRRLEINLRGNEIISVGIPDTKMINSIDSAIGSALIAQR